MAETTSQPRTGRSRRGASSRINIDLLDRLGLSRVVKRMEQPGPGAKVFGTIKTLAWVIPLTILLWIYAEREQLTPVNDVPLQINLRMASTDRIAVLLSPEDHRIFADLQGPRAGLAAARDAVLDGRYGPLNILIGELPIGFEGEIPIADRLSRNEVLSRNAVTILRTRPGVRIRVEAKVTRSIPVKVRPEDKIVGTVVFDPPAVNVEGPASLFASTPADRLVAYADLGKFAGRAPGQYDDRVALSVPFRNEYVTAPATVYAKVELKRSEPVVLPAIPVVVEMPSGVLEADKYRVKVQQVTLPNVSVTGPPEAIGPLKEGKVVGAAVVTLTPEDFAKPGEKVKRLRPEDYRMPKDVTVTNPEREVTVTITEKG